MTSFRYRRELELRWTEVNRQLDDLAAGKAAASDVGVAELEEILLDLRQDLEEKLTEDFAYRHRHGCV
ncbi:hypothetical protein [Lacipirellula limnantheis]|uniref:Uncharacterized protein n=1 Tax=Lacipirellula limnantheis TaxID=2528024 RepID=A0A517TYB5_9BACT|nr:hypothetical protein [Lacipirellula limnantheis]QDT73367.1 hypothetical protein I41_25560 [Lacipirellula limnantheis]